MITVTIDECYDRFSARMQGHAGYAESGSDIVCAAASILAYSLAETLGRKADEGALEAFGSSFDDGFKVEFVSENEAVLGAWELFKTGIELLMQNFPENIDFSQGGG